MPSTVLQTDSAHNGSSITHNASPSFGPHAHSVVAVNRVSLYSTPHTSNRTPMHSHATLMERQPSSKSKRLNKVETQFPESGDVHQAMAPSFRITPFYQVQPFSSHYLFHYIWLKKIINYSFKNLNTIYSLLLC